MGNTAVDPKHTKDLHDAHASFASAQGQISKAKKQLKEAKRDYALAEKQYKQARWEMSHAEDEIDDAEEQLKKYTTDESQKYSAFVARLYKIYATRGVDFVYDYDEDDESCNFCVNTAGPIGKIICLDLSCANRLKKAWKQAANSTNQITYKHHLLLCELVCRDIAAIISRIMAFRPSIIENSDE
jgi:chromosome segregation ATPase